TKRELEQGANGRGAAAPSSPRFPRLPNQGRGAISEAMPNDKTSDTNSPDCGPGCGGPRVRAIPPGEDR
ncbi:hypothetical protein ABTL11_20405, partial [Acinetobacter baumannii]